MDEEFLEEHSINSSKNLIEIPSKSTKDSNNETEYWITIFGFPTDQRNNVLDLFSKHGDIVSQKVDYFF